MDMTAQDRVYWSRAANHAPDSGNISTNHSCNTGGYLWGLDAASREHIPQILTLLAPCL